MFPYHSSISDNLIMIVDSFDLALSFPTNPGPTRFSDTAGESNSVIDLMFLQYGSAELDKHSILPDSRLSSDHAPLVKIVDGGLHLFYFSFSFILFFFAF